MKALVVPATLRVLRCVYAGRIDTEDALLVMDFAPSPRRRHRPVRSLVERLDRGDQASQLQPSKALSAIIAARWRPAPPRRFSSPRGYPRRL